MLRFLSISRLAVIDRLELEFAPGFNVLTGETGAGKSILVGAVGLLVGGLASAELVRTGEETAAVQAVFEKPDGGEVIVRREVSSQGRSRAFVDGALVTSAALREAAGSLVDLHGQHEHQVLLDPATHLDLLDEFAGLTPDRDGVAAAFRAWQQVRDERARLAGAAPARLQEIEDRLALLERLKKKHGPALADVIAKAASLRRELHDIEHATERAAELDAALGTAAAAYRQVAGDLSTRRRAAAREFSKALEKALADLAMAKTRCEVRFIGDANSPSAGGEAAWS